MKRVMTALFLLLLPGMFLGLVFLSVNHYMVDQEIRRMETLQERLIERNKRHIVQHSMLSGPGVILTRVQEELDKSFVQPEQIIYLRVATEGEK